MLIRWVGGLIVWIRRLEIFVSTGGRGIGAVDSVAWAAWGSRQRCFDGQRRYHGWWFGGLILSVRVSTINWLESSAIRVY